MSRCMPACGSSKTKKSSASPMHDRPIRRAPRSPYADAMRYETKTALVLRADLLAWQTANVAAFLTGGLAGAYPEIVGESYADARCRLYTPLAREPIVIVAAETADMQPTSQ